MSRILQFRHPVLLVETSKYKSLKIINAHLHVSSAKKRNAQLCELIASHFADGSAIGSVKVMGRDSGPKGAYAHQCLDRGTKPRPKAEGDFVFKIALDPLARCEEGKPAGAPGAKLR